jgi:hypothetical protein
MVKREVDMEKRERKVTPLWAIRLYCLNECASAQRKEVRLCPSEKCPLYPYRMGFNPARKGIGPGRVLSKMPADQAAGDPAQVFLSHNAGKGRRVGEAVLGGSEVNFECQGQQILKRRKIGQVEIEEDAGGTLLIRVR